MCWLLARLHDIPEMPALTFKGGTSLSKVHRLIERFSEDIDLTFSRDGWGFEGDRNPLDETLSQKKRAALIEEIRARSESVVRDRVAPALRKFCERTLGPRGWSVDIDSTDSQTVLFTYPSPAASYTYGRPVVKAEFGARGEPWPTIQRVVKPYLEELYADVAPTAVVEVVTLLPERTFWEKATLLHALHHGTLAKPDKKTERRSRHLYDLHRMWNDPELKARILANPSLLLAVVRNSQVFFKEGKAQYELIASFQLNATPHTALEATLRADYDEMRTMFFPRSAVPSFDELLVSLQELDQTVAGWRTA